jgi:hypothetical protein
MKVNNTVYICFLLYIASHYIVSKIKNGTNNSNSNNNINNNNEKKKDTVQVIHILKKKYDRKIYTTEKEKKNG